MTTLNSKKCKILSGSDVAMYTQLVLACTRTDSSLESSIS